VRTEGEQWLTTASENEWSMGEDWGQGRASLSEAEWSMNSESERLPSDGNGTNRRIPFTSTCHLVLVVCLNVTFGYSELTDASGISMQSLTTTHWMIYIYEVKRG